MSETTNKDTPLPAAEPTDEDATSAASLTPPDATSNAKNSTNSTAVLTPTVAVDHDLASQLQDLVDSEPEISGLALLRDSAVQLAAATGLLYIVGHAYTSVYLNCFGIDAGFQGFTLDGLSMLNLTTVFGIGACGFACHTVFTTTKLRWRRIALLTILAIGTTPTFIAISHGVWPVQVNVLQDVLVITLAVAFTVYNKRISKTLEARREIDEQVRKMEKLLKASERALAPMKRTLAQLAADGRVSTSEARDLGSAISDRQELQHVSQENFALVKNFATRRRRRNVIWAVLASGYVTAIVALPSFAIKGAIDSASSIGWKATDGNTVRIPVYWNGDRIIYVTRENGECLVSVDSGGTLQSRRQCPPLISAVATP